jgi:hypothetical protein
VAGFDGQQWRTLREGKLSRPDVLWAESPTHLFASVGSLVFERNGDRWSENVLPVFSYVMAFGGLSHNDVFASMGNSSMLHYNGSVWTVAVDSLAGHQRDMCALPSGTILSGGEKSIYRFDGSWQPILEGDFFVDAITGDESGDILAAGASFDSQRTNQPASALDRRRISSWQELAGSIDGTAHSSRR